MCCFNQKNSIKEKSTLNLNNVDSNILYVYTLCTYDIISIHVLSNHMLFTKFQQYC